MIQLRVDPLHVLLLLTYTLAANAYDTRKCCLAAQQHGALLESVSPAFTCGQEYSEGRPPSEDASISYEFCIHHCPGIGLSNLGQPSEWAAPLVQFILPAVIFCASIPRSKAFEVNFSVDTHFAMHRKNRWLYGILSFVISLGISMLLIVQVVLDTIVWISYIFCMAADMLVGGLYEAHLDYWIIRYLEEHHDLSEKRRVELLVTLVCGNLRRPVGLPHYGILEALEASTTSQKKARLMGLMTAQQDFGSSVGAPVLFYLGPFVYSILDLLDNPSDDNAANALAFGIQWMIIVNVSILSGCLRASNNPSTSCAIVGIHPEVAENQQHELDSSAEAQSQPPSPLSPSTTRNPMRRYSTFSSFHKPVDSALKIRSKVYKFAYETGYQPVALRWRGRNKLEWLRNTTGFAHDEKLQKRVHMSPLARFFGVFLPSMILVVVPPTAAAIVAYRTPPIGFSCRSLGFLCYAASQTVLAAVSTLRTTIPVKQSVKRTFKGRVLEYLVFFAFTTSAISGIGGTIMQLTGVFRNCICTVSARHWLNLYGPGAAISVASDTQLQRESSDVWILIGTAASLFMMFGCYVGWWCQRVVSHRFSTEVEKIDGRRVEEAVRDVEKSEIIDSK